MEGLEITHDAGFFSCCSKRLEAIISFFNSRHALPDFIDSTKQFSLYKNSPMDDAIALYFRPETLEITHSRAVHFHNDAQFLPYQTLNITSMQPFVQKYFSPSERVERIVVLYEKKYVIDYTHTCAVYYRGNDKSIETAIAPYEIFFAKAREIKKTNPMLIFLVQSDEAEFLEAFLREFPGSISFNEILPIQKKNSFVAAELEQTERVKHGMYFFASLLVLSKCEFFITHSGNGALWCVLYRGHTNNVFQWLNGSWNPGRSIRTIWQNNKWRVKKVLHVYSGWKVVSR